MCKYVDQKGSAAMLTSIQSAGVTPEVNLRITQARKHAFKGSTLALKPRADVTRSQNRGISGPTKKDFKKKKRIEHWEKYYIKLLSRS